MKQPTKTYQNRLVILTGLGISLLISVVLSPHASQNPDGLDRVAQDLKFDAKAHPAPIATKMPFAAVFDEYALRGVPEAVATPLAGLAGTVATFGLAWGLGKVTVRGHRPNTDRHPENHD
jgi:cobalt/nickel transport protein